MISSAADYEFVTGIQDGEIVIDGDILPVRESYEEPEGIQQPRCLRGEDVAFLAEAANERNGVIEGMPQVTAFNRQVSATQMRTICTNLHRYLKSPGSSSVPCYFKKDYLFAEKWYSNDDLPSGEYVYYNDVEEIAPHRLYPDGILLDKSASPNDFQDGDSQRLDNMRKLFTDVARQRRMYCGNQNAGESALDISSDFTVDTHYYDESTHHEPTDPHYDNSSILFYNVNSVLPWWGIYDTWSLSSFALTLPIPSFSSGRISSVTVLAIAYGRSYWQLSSSNYVHEKVMGIIPIAASRDGGQWILTRNDASSIVDKVAAKMRRPIRGSGVWPSGTKCLLHAYVGLLGATPIVTLDDHTDF